MTLTLTLTLTITIAIAIYAITIAIFDIMIIIPSPIPSPTARHNNSHAEVDGSYPAIAGANTIIDPANDPVDAWCSQSPYAAQKRARYFPERDLRRHAHHQMSKATGSRRVHTGLCRGGGGGRWDDEGRVPCH